MQILHPYITLALLLLWIYSYRETFAEEYVNFKGVWAVIGFLIIIAGFRSWGIDYPSYLNMFQEFGSTMQLDYSSLKNNEYNIEWLYVAYNIIIYNLGLPFVFFTVLTAIITVTTKYWVFEKFSAYPALSMLLYCIPVFFMGDMGHMRQAMATSITFISFIAITQRKLWLFAILMYLAVSFHNSSYVFIFAYFIAVIPLNRWWILVLVGLSMALSPFKVYEFIPILNNIAPEEVIQGFENYVDTEEIESGAIKFYDLLSLFYLYFIFFYDKETRRIIPYYEYMRNLSVAGICIYFIFRASPIFSTRLVSYYFLFLVITVPNIIAAIQVKNLKRYLFAVITVFVLFYYFVFANMQGKRAFSPTTYTNFLLPG